MNTVTVRNLTKSYENFDLSISEFSLRAGRIAGFIGRNGAGKTIPPAPKGKNIWGTVTINERGQIVIPKAAREHFNLAPGQRLVLMSEDGEGFAMVLAEWFEKRIDALR